MGRTGRTVAVFGCALLLWLSAADAQTVGRAIEDSYAEHTRAVETARAGNYEEGLGILRDLLAEFPDDYPLNRDFIVISSWNNDCDTVLTRFERVRTQPHFEPYLVRAVADCAIKRARAGDTQTALNALEALAARQPDDYPLARDIIVIHAWRRECGAALERYDASGSRPPPEPFFAIAVSDCLLEAERPKEAAALIGDALAQAPEDERLLFAQRKALGGLPLAEGDFPYREAAFDLLSDESDQGLREWRAEADLSKPVARGTRAFVRSLVTRSDDAALRDGDMDRVGAGVRYRFDRRWSGEAELSGDVRTAGQGGASAEVSYEPDDEWHMTVGHTSFAEDLPLRARAAEIDGWRTDAGAEFNSLDGVWHARASASKYEFSDSNKRVNLFAALGYAFELLPYREQRVFVEWYQSRNSLDGAPYFNPQRDRSLGLVHRTDFVFASRYLRHVDSLYLNVSAYDQDDFGTHGRWGAAYEQNYRLDDFNQLVWGVTYARNVYDGAGESEARAELRYVRRF